MSNRSRIQSGATPTTGEGQPQGAQTQSVVVGAAEVFENWYQIQEVARQSFSEMLQQRGEDGKPLHTREELAESTAFYNFTVNLQRSYPQLRIPDHQLSDLNKFLRMDLLGLGMLDLYLADPEIEDIFLDRWDTLDIIKGGVKTRIAQAPFESDQAVFQWLQARVFAPINKDFNRSNPSENAVLPDGSRLIAVTQPISPYTSFAVRRHRKEVFQTTDAYMQTGIAPVEFFNDLQSWVLDCRNMIMSGATGSGKTTFVNVAASLIPDNERLLTLEDTPELQIQHPRVKPMYTFEKGSRAGDSGERDIPMSDLLRYALRMKPDRIIIGEVRDRETFDMLDALNTGHAGSFTTLHSNSAVDALTRLQMMSSRHPARGNLDGNTLQDLIASVIDVIVQIKNFEGVRRVVAVEQVIYGPHYAERPETFQQPGMRRIYPNLFLRPLWRWNGSTLEKANDFLAPDHG
jgi:pilus assembly protein CpaF